MANTGRSLIRVIAAYVMPLVAVATYWLARAAASRPPGGLCDAWIPICLQGSGPFGFVSLVWVFRLGYYPGIAVVFSCVWLLWLAVLFLTELRSLPLWVHLLVSLVWHFVGGLAAFSIQAL